jgi:hypothetical protein
MDGDVMIKTPEALRRSIEQFMLNVTEPLDPLLPEADSAGGDVGGYSLRDGIQRWPAKARGALPLLSQSGVRQSRALIGFFKVL